MAASRLALGVTVLLAFGFPLHWAAHQESRLGDDAHYSRLPHK